MKHVSIIGGSMAGLSSAYHIKRLAKQQGEDAEVTVYEGKPNLHKTCSGIVTSAFPEALHEGNVPFPKGLISAKVSHVRIYSPNQQYLELDFKKPDLVFDRERLNEYFAGKAEDEGCTIKREHRFTGFGQGGKKVSIKDVRQQRTTDEMTDILVGADGSLSPVAKAAGVYDQGGSKRRFFLAIKTLIKCRHDNAIEFYPYFKDFAWRNPVDEETLEVGVATEAGDGITANAIFEKFSALFPEKQFSKEAALIPIYNPKTKFFARANGMPVYMIGDSATHAKATTGGSIVQINEAAPILARHALEGKEGTSHENDVKKKIGRELWVHLKMHEALSRFSEKDWNRLVSAFQDPGLKEILAETPRDRPISLAMKLLARKPSLLLFGTKLFA